MTLSHFALYFAPLITLNMAMRAVQEQSGIHEVPAASVIPAARKDEQYKPRIGLKRFLTESNGGLPDDIHTGEVVELMDMVDRGEVSAELAAKIRANADDLLERSQIMSPLHAHIMQVLDKVK